jgi:hypothetical protein
MPNNDDTAEELAQSHFTVEPDIVAIFRVLAGQRESQPSERAPGGTTFLKVLEAGLEFAVKEYQS